MDDDMQALMADVPPPDAQVGPLQWNGEMWTRFGNEVLRDVWGEPYPPRQIGPGWTVWSRLQVHAKEAPDWQAREMYGGRSGVCLDVREWPDPNGELRTVYDCVEVWRHHVYRLVVPHDDVFQAKPSARQQVGDLRMELFASLGPDRSGARGLRHVRREWIENATMLLAEYG